MRSSVAHSARIIQTVGAITTSCNGQAVSQRGIGRKRESRGRGEGGGGVRGELTNDRRSCVVKTVTPTVPAPFLLSDSASFISSSRGHFLRILQSLWRRPPRVIIATTYQLKPSLINAGLSHSRNDGAFGAPYVTPGTHCFAYVYFINRANALSCG